MVDKNGFRLGVAIILVNSKKQVFWGRRVGQNAWQFPQGGMLHQELPEEAMYRELREEIGVLPEDVELLASSKEWLQYRLPIRMVRHYSQPVCVGQMHKWFLLQLKNMEAKICFNMTDMPEFDDYRWVKYWYPLRRIVAFKRRVYRLAMQEFAPILFPGRKGFVANT